MDQDIEVIQHVNNSAHCITTHKTFLEGKRNCSWCEGWTVDEGKQEWVDEEQQNKKSSTIIQITFKAGSQEIFDRLWVCSSPSTTWIIFYNLEWSVQWWWCWQPCCRPREPVQAVTEVRKGDMTMWSRVSSHSRTKSESSITYEALDESRRKRILHFEIFSIREKEEVR